jgi:ATP-dependent RNA helicase RhlE
MLRKLISKIRQTFKADAKRPETKPAHKSARPAAKSGHPRHEKRGGHAPRQTAPRSTAASVKPAVATPRAAPASKPLPEVPKMDTPFTALGLGDRIAYAVQEKGYENPTPIQAQAIPVVLSGKDVIGSAQTGTGKTAAFSLPILQRLGAHGKIRCLVLEPTRELALQVEESFKVYSKFTDLRTTVIYGGVGYGKQRDDLARGMDILVATPGRLLDFMEQGEIRLDHIETLVLDEVDRMLDMGFLPDVKRIVAKVPKTRQTLFFTATLPPEIEQLAAWALRDPFKISVSRERSTAETISHAFYPVVQGQKFELLAHLLEQTQYHSVIIFSRTKSGADYVANRLKHAGHTCAVMHSDRSQQERVDALKGFKSGKHEVLVATDIAARGLDIADVSHVINFDVPENPRGLRPPHRPHRPRAEDRRRLHPGDRGDLARCAQHRALHRHEHRVEEGGRLQLHLFGHLRRRRQCRRRRPKSRRAASCAAAGAKRLSE